MKRIITIMLGLLATIGLTVGLSSAASAAPPVAHTSATQSPLLKLGTDLGLFTITGFGGTEYDATTGTITAPVVGNPEASHQVIQKGGITLAKADGSSLTISNIKYDMDNLVITGVINDVRVALYDTEQLTATSAKLLVDPEGGALMRSFINLFGLPADGSDFGTATLL